MTSTYGSMPAHGSCTHFTPDGSAVQQLVELLRLRGLGPHQCFRILRRRPPCRRRLRSHPPAIRGSPSGASATRGELTPAPYRSVNRRRPTGAGMMATVPDDHATLQELARRHLWLHFSRLGAFADHDIPMFVRGEGVHLFDDTGKRYLDGLSGLFVVQIGHGRREIAEAGGRAGGAARLLPHLVRRPPCSGRARGAARGHGARRPQPRVLHDRRLRGGRVRMEARPGVLPRHRPARPHEGHRPHARLPRHDHGGAVDHRPARDQDRVRAVGAGHGRTSPTRTGSGRRSRPRSSADDERFAAACADAIEQAIIAEGPETVCAVYLEPVQNTGGCFPPPPGYFARVREICDRLRRAARVGRGDLRLRTARRDVRGRPLRVPARHDHVRQGRHVGLRATRRRDRARHARRTVPVGDGQLRSRHHVRRASGQLRDGARQPRRLRTRRDHRARPGERARVPPAHGVVARPRHRRRRPRRRLLPRRRTREGSRTTTPCGSRPTSANA